MTEYDVIVIGGGQSALACGYYLNRAKLDFLILDDQANAGGSWQHTWPSLTLFSPAANSSLPGWPMPASSNKFPSKQEVIDYLIAYEKRYALPVHHPVTVTGVHQTGDGFSVESTTRSYQTRSVIAATGTWASPFIPDVPGRADFNGAQIHASQYTGPASLLHKKVLIVGEGNSGAQILAELSSVTQTVWATNNPPRFLPDDVDGSVLFNVATAKYHAQRAGKPFDSANYNLGNIVMVPAVLEARDRGTLISKGRIARVVPSGVIWENGAEETFDTIIWCTGFIPAVSYLTPLQVVGRDNKVKTAGSRATDVQGLWLVGFGNWTGFAAATLAGVGKIARDTVNEITEYIKIRKSVTTT